MNLVLSNASRLKQFSSLWSCEVAYDSCMERYTPERIAEFLLSNAVDQDDYGNARKEVRKLGLDPDLILHARP